MSDLTHHAISYTEIAVTDIAAAKRFYGAAFGWEFNDYGDQYAGIRTPGNPSVEMGGLAAGQAQGGPRPFVLLYSDDLDRTVDAVRTAGGTIVKGPYEFPGGRRFHFTDPSGNELGVFDLK